MKETRLCKLKSIQFETVDSIDVYFRGVEINSKNHDSIAMITLITDQGEEIEIKGGFFNDKILNKLITKRDNLITFTMEVKEENLI